jgi:hypothetical protein
MTLTGNDAFGPWIDTGCAVLPTDRSDRDNDVDSHDLPGAVAEADPGRADKILKTPKPTRQASSPR